MGKVKKLGSSIRGERELTALLLAAFAFSCTTIYFANPSLTAIQSSRSPPGILGSSSSSSSGGGDDRKKSNQNNTTTLSSSATKTTTTSTSTIKGAPRSTISDLITWMLLGKDKDANTHHAALARLDDSPYVPLEFIPGTLSLSHVQTFQHCYADPNIYKNHFQGGRDDGSNILVSYSETHKLAYIMLPKCASSTARHVLKNDFQARERKISLQPKDYDNENEETKLDVVTFVRDPLSRFYSQYDEAFIRNAPWQQKQDGSTSHPFPYLYENIHSYQEYEDVFCPIETRSNRKECVFRESKENGTLTSRFERLVKEYNGRDPFDVHLTLQAPMLSSNDGLPLHITQIYNTSDTEAGWNSIAKQFLGENATLGSGKKESGVIEGRSYPRRFNSELVSIGTQRRICQLMLLDYCCLNMPLPDVCKGLHYSTDGGDQRELFCVLDSRGYIQPGIFPG